jgi:hypothetical protein
MKCSNPNCNRGLGLVVYRRGWFSKRRYCSKDCRDNFAAVETFATRTEPHDLLRVALLGTIRDSAAVLDAAVVRVRAG